MCFLVLTVIVTVATLLGQWSHSYVAEEVVREFYAFRSWINERIDDPFMSDQRWRDLIPLCRFADDRIAMYYGELAYRDSCETLVLQIIGESDEEDALVD